MLCVSMRMTSVSSCTRGRREKAEERSCGCWSAISAVTWLQQLPLSADDAAAVAGRVQVLVLVVVHHADHVGAQPLLRGRQAVVVRQHYAQLRTRGQRVQVHVVDECHVRRVHPQPRVLEHDLRAQAEVPPRHVDDGHVARGGWGGGRVDGVEVPGKDGGGDGAVEVRGLIAHHDGQGRERGGRRGGRGGEGDNQRVGDAVELVQGEDGGGRRKRSLAAEHGGRGTAGSKAGEEASSGLHRWWDESRGAALPVRGSPAHNPADSETYMRREARAVREEGHLLHAGADGTMAEIVDDEIC